MERRGYPPEFRRKVLDLFKAGREVADVARDLGISDQTIYTWRHQDRTDRGLEPGLSSPEKAELAAAKRRIAQLEAELAVHRRATELAWDGGCLTARRGLPVGRGESDTAFVSRRASFPRVVVEHCNERCLPGHDPDGTSDGFPMPMVISGDAEGSSQFSTERISSRPMATHPQVGLPSVTWRKIPATRPGMRCGFTAMLTA